MKMLHETAVAFFVVSYFCEKTRIVSIGDRPLLKPDSLPFHVVQRGFE